MGGPWRDRGYDPRTWRPPVPRVEAAAHGSDAERGRLMGIVFGYVALVVTTITATVTVLKYGW
ncbi:MAG: hypothetical protein ACRELA_14315 [Candidatus Rokuibacteriota bacterium]